MVIDCGVLGLHGIETRGLSPHVVGKAIGLLWIGLLRSKTMGQNTIGNLVVVHISSHALDNSSPTSSISPTRSTFLPHLTHVLINL